MYLVAYDRAKKSFRTYLHHKAFARPNLPLKTANSKHVKYLNMSSRGFFHTALASTVLTIIDLYPVRYLSLDTSQPSREVVEGIHLS